MDTIFFIVASRTWEASMSDAVFLGLPRRIVLAAPPTFLQRVFCYGQSVVQLAGEPPPNRIAANDPRSIPSTTLFPSKSERRRFVPANRSAENDPRSIPPTPPMPS